MKNNQRRAIEKSAEKNIGNFDTLPHSVDLLAALRWLFFFLFHNIIVRENVTLVWKCCDDVAKDFQQIFTHFVYFKRQFCSFFSFRRSIWIILSTISLSHQTFSKLENVFDVKHDKKLSKIPRRLIRSTLFIYCWLSRFHFFCEVEKMKTFRSKQSTTTARKKICSQMNFEWKVVTLLSGFPFIQCIML